MNTESISKHLYNQNRKRIDKKYSLLNTLKRRCSRNAKFLKKHDINSLFKYIYNDIGIFLYRNKKNNVKTMKIDFDNKYLGKKIAIYTSIYGDYDILQEPMYKDKNCDYFIFTDRKISRDSIWKKREITFSDSIKTNFMRNRYIKIFGYKLFSDYDYSIYIDGNITVVSEISLYLNNFFSNCGIAMHMHPSNNCIYDEARVNYMAGKITKNEYEEIINLYNDKKMPRKYGMFECNVIIRENNNPLCFKIMKSWWQHLVNGIKRDQLYFTLALYENSVDYNDVQIIAENINFNPMFIRGEHK